MSESTDLRVVGAMIDIIEGATMRGNTRNSVIESIETILIEGTSIRIEKREEIAKWVAQRYWQEPEEEGAADA